MSYAYERIGVQMMRRLRKKMIPERPSSEMLSPIAEAVGPY